MEILLEKLKARLRSRSGKIIFAISAIALIITVYFLYKQFFPEMDLQELLTKFADFFGAWTYLIIGAVGFLETGAFVGLFIPGDTIMILGGAVAGLGDINIYLLIGIAWIMAFLGDSFSFLLGKKLGRGFIVKHGKMIAINEERLEKVEKYFDSHGGKTILIGRFIGLIRAIAPFVAGSSGMSYRVFLPYSILGSGAQMSSHILLGYFFAKSINVAKQYAETAALGISSLIVVGILLYLLLRYLRIPANRIKIIYWLDNNPIGKPILSFCRFVKPGFVFVIMRLTPGTNFGLEVTSLTAAAAVSLFVMASYVSMLGGNHDLITHGDQVAINISSFIQSNLIDLIAEAFVFLGKRIVLVPVVMLASLYFIFERKWYIVIVLLVSCSIISSGNEIIDYLIQRPHTDSFPNKAAAYSVVYVWIAATLIVKIKPEIRKATSIIVAGLLMTVLVGLSNVYLGNNYLSDTNAGWAFGVFVFSAVSLVMLVLHQLKEKPDSSYWRYRVIQNNKTGK